jgi:hypothetical protein
MLKKVLLISGVLTVMSSGLYAAWFGVQSTYDGGASGRWTAQGVAVCPRLQIRKIVPQ